jgi:hypothetical protein
MTELVVADKASEWRQLKALVLDSVAYPITRRITGDLVVGVFNVKSPKTRFPLRSRSRSC